MRPAPRSLLLVTVDCLRADHTGFLGYSRQTTPFLDSLADESFVFRNAIASGIPTYYSLPALLASRYPLALGRDLIGLGTRESTIASELRESGFKTAAFAAGNPYVSPFFGYENGFDIFRDFLNGPKAAFAIRTANGRGVGLRQSFNQTLSRGCHSVPLLGAAYDELYFWYCQKASHSVSRSLDDLRRFPSADVIVECAIAWLKENSRGPFFLWLHLMDPHAPYYPKAQALQELGCEHITASDAKHLNSYWQRTDLGPERLQKKRDSIVTLYDAGIRWVDAQIQKLSDKLIQLNLWNECALAVTADHGEEFLEHGGRFHAPVRLHEE